MILYFLTTKAFPKLIVTEAVYGNYYWPKAPWLFIHVVSSILATIIGPVQFVASIRTNYLNAHRISGKIYMGCILFASITAVYLAINSSYVVTLFFIVFVIIDEFLPFSYFGSYEETLPFLTWVSWAIPLFITELGLQSRKISST